MSPRLFSSPFTLLLLAFFAFTSVRAEVDEVGLRVLMADSRFVGLVSPCTAGGSARTTAGEWLRTAFHDAGSYNAALGTGGLDGSVDYETTRSENTGSFLTGTLIQYRSLQIPGVSLADMVALGAITAIGACGGPQIPFLAGRVDAKSAAEEGHLPLPEETLETHQQKFARMGFSNDEMIAAVACGHTIGGVHRVNNPTITSTTNQGFDLTRTTFDNGVAVEYRDGVLTNPLAQPYNPNNPAMSSDSRIFGSDGNVTLNRYAASQADFFTDCVSIFSKMFNEAVPSSTTLTAPIEPYPVSLNFVVSLRAGTFHIQIGNARLYGLEGQWSTFDVIPYDRNGNAFSSTQITALWTLRALRTLSNGANLQVRDFVTKSPGVSALTGMSAIGVKLTMNDGSVYSSAGGNEKVTVEDSINIDTGAAFTCMYTDPTTAAVGVNITIQVYSPLGYNAADKVEIYYEDSTDSTRLTYGTPIRASYRQARPDTPYIYYGVFVSNIKTNNFGNFAARITRSSGVVSIDNRRGFFFKQDSLNDCVAGATVPTPAPQPTVDLGRRSYARRVVRHCPLPGWSRCLGVCVDTQNSLESCGGCMGAGGVDCTAMEGNVACVKGVCRSA